MDLNQSWTIGKTWEPSFVDEVQGHISRSKVVRSSCKKMVSFEKLKSDWNQIGFIDIILEPSHVHAVKGHNYT